MFSARAADGRLLRHLRRDRATRLSGGRRGRAFGGWEVLDDLLCGDMRGLDRRGNLGHGLDNGGFGLRGFDLRGHRERRAVRPSPALPSAQRDPGSTDGLCWPASAARREAMKRPSTTASAMTRHMSRPALMASSLPGIT